MKRITLFLILAVTILATGCKRDEPKVFRLDPNATVKIKPAPTVQKSAQFVKSNSEHLSPLEVVKQTTTLIFHNSMISSSPIYMIWTDNLKDTVSYEPALLRYASDIIYDKTGYGNYGLQTDFIYGSNMVLCKGQHPIYDTIAYIPNSNIVNARTIILSALEAKDTASVYGVFNDAFKFVPITGSEYKELQKKGLN
jgi:hypothetical protein